MDETSSEPDFRAAPAEGWPKGFSRADERAVRDVVLALRDASRRRSLDGVAALYAENVRWMNAFGSRLCGRQAVLDYVGLLWSTPQFQARGVPVNESMDY